MEYPEYTEITALLEKYWSAETSVEEEKLLAAYFRQTTIAPDLEPYRQLFAWWGEEAMLTAGEGLEKKIWEGIRQADNAQADNLQAGNTRAGKSRQADNAQQVGITRPGQPGAAIVRPLYTKTSWYAAAALILITLGVFLLTPPAKKDGNGTGVTLAKVDSQTKTPQKIGALSDNVQDTYDDPRQALAAIKKALLTASVKMNKGKNITRQQMNRMNDSWQAAVSN
jgi:hypothetical protein